MLNVNYDAAVLARRCYGADKVTCHKSTWVNMLYSREFLVDGGLGTADAPVPPKTRAKIVCVGDDNTSGSRCDVLKPWPALLGESMAGLYAVRNLGRDGASAVHFKTEFADTRTAVLSSRASAVVVMLVSMAVKCLRVIVHVYS